MMFEFRFCTRYLISNILYSVFFEYQISYLIKVIYQHIYYSLVQVHGESCRISMKDSNTYILGVSLFFFFLKFFYIVSSHKKIEIIREIVLSL